MMDTMTRTPVCLVTSCTREVGPHRAFCAPCKAVRLDLALDLRLDAEKIEPDALVDCDYVIAQVSANRRADWAALSTPA